MHNYLLFEKLYNIWIKYSIEILKRALKHWIEFNVEIFIYIEIIELKSIFEKVFESMLKIKNSMIKCSKSWDGI